MWSYHVSHNVKTTLLRGGFYVVDISDNTLNRLKAYLSRFWENYQTSVNLQKALENA
jgi:hypothetical protein